MAAASLEENHVSQSKLTLRIEIYDRNPVTGIETLSVRRQMPNVDPTMTAYEFCEKIFEQIKEKYPEQKGDKIVQKYRDATPRLGWALFMPEDAGRIASSFNTDATADVTDIANARTFTDYKAQYLEADRTLHSYLITNGITLHYKKRHRPLPIDVFGQTKRVLIDDSWAVYEIVEEIGHVLDIPNSEEYSLKVVDDPSDPEAGWLRGHLTLHDQEVDLTPQEELGGRVRPLIFKKKLYAANDSPIDVADETVLYLLYSQCLESVLQSLLPITEREAITLAALQLQADEGDYDSKVHKKGFITDLTRYLPVEYAGVNKIEAQIYKTYKGFRRTSRGDALKKYIKFCRSNENYGWSFWRVREEVVFGRKTQYKERLLGFSGSGVITLDPRTKKEVNRRPWTDVIKYGEDAKGFYIVFPDQENPFRCLPPERQKTIPVLIQFVTDYLFMIQRRREHDIDSELVIEESVWDEPTPSVATVGMGKGKKKKKKKKHVFADNDLPSPLDVAEQPHKTFSEVNEDIKKAADAYAVKIRDLELAEPVGMIEIPDDATPEDAENIRLDTLAASRDEIKDLTAAIAVVSSELIDSAGSVDPKKRSNGAVALASAEAVAAYADQLGDASKMAAAASKTDEEKKQLSDSYKALAVQTGNLLATLGSLSLDDMGMTDDQVNDLLAAANDLNSALNGLLGATGVKQAGGETTEALKSEAETIHDLVVALAQMGEQTVFQGMIRSDADQLNSRIQQLPNFSSQLKMTVVSLGGNVQLPIVKQGLEKKAGLLLHMVDLVAHDIPNSNEELLAAARRVSDALNALISKTGDAANPPDYTAEIRAAAAEIDAAVAGLLTHADDNEAAADSVADIVKAVGTLGGLANLEVDGIGEMASHDSLLDAARDLSNALAALKGAQTALEGDEDNEAKKEARNAAARRVADASSALLTERTQIAVMRAVADAAFATADVTEEVIAALDEDLDRPQERTVHDAERASSRLLSAARIYTVDPSNLARQDELIQAARKASRKILGLQELALGGIGSTDPDNLLDLAGSLADALANLQGSVTAATDALWALDVNSAIETILAQEKHVDEATALCEDADVGLNANSNPFVALSGERSDVANQTQVQWKASLVTSLEATPSLIDKMADDSLHATMADVGQAAKDLAAEVANSIYAAVGLASTTASSERQHTLLTASREVCDDAIACIRTAAAAVKKPTEAQASVDAAVIEVKEAEAGLRRAIPGLGDIERGIAALLEVSSGIDVDDSPADGFADLLSVTDMLAGAMANLSAAGFGGDDDGDDDGPTDGVARTDVIGTYQNEVKSAARALRSAVKKIAPASQSTPDELGDVANAVSNISVAIVESTQAAAGTEELANDRYTLLANLKSMADNVVIALEAGKVLAVDAEDERAIETLDKSEVGESLTALNAAIKVAASIEDKGEFDSAVDQVKRAEPKLASIPAPSPDANIKSLQAHLVASVNSLAEAMVQLQNTAEGNPRGAGAAAKSAALMTVKLINAASACAAAVPVEDPAAAAGPADAGPQIDVSEELKDLLKKAMSAMSKILRAKPAEEAAFKSATEGLVRAVVDLANATDAIAARLPSRGEELAAASSAVKTHTGKLAKTAGSHVKKPDSEKHHKSFISHSKDLLTALKALETLADELSQGAASSAASASSVRDDIVSNAQTAVAGVLQMLGVAKVIVADDTDLSSHKVLHKSLKHTARALNKLQETSKLIVPGQKECAWAGDEATDAANDLNKAALDFSVQKLKLDGLTGTFDSKLSSLLDAADALADALANLAAAASTSPDDVGPAATELGGLFDPFVTAAIEAVVTAPDPSLGAALIRAAKDVPEELVSFIATAREAGGDPAAAGDVDAALDKAMAVIGAVKSALEADKNAQEQCEAAAAAVRAAAEPLAADASSFAAPGDGTTYSTAQGKLKKQLITMVKAAQKLVSSAQKPASIGVLVTAIAEVYPDIVALEMAVIGLAGDDAKEPILAASRAATDGVVELIEAGGAVIGGGGDASSMSLAMKSVSDSLAALLKGVEAGATGAHAIESAVEEVNNAIAGLNAAAFQVTTHQLKSDAPFSAAADKVLELLGELPALATAVAKCTTAEDAGAAGGAAAEALGTILGFVELAAAALDIDDDQVSLIDAARNLALALAGLIGATSESTKEGSTPDVALLANTLAAVDALKATIAHAAEADARTAQAMAAVAASIGESKERLAGGASELSAEPNQVSAAATTVLRTSQRLLFASTKNAGLMVSVAEELPAVVSSLVSTYLAAAGAFADTDKATVDAVIDAVIALLNSVAGPDDSSEAAKAVSQAVTAVLAAARTASGAGAAGGGDPREVFEAELAHIKESVDECVQRINTVTAGGISAEGVDAGDAASVVELSTKIADAANSLILAALGAYDSVGPDGADELMIAARNVAAAMDELTAAISAFASGDADASFLERAAKVVSSAVFEVINTVLKDEGKSAEKSAMKKAAKTLGKSCQGLIATSQTILKKANKPVATDGGSVDGGSVDGDSEADDEDVTASIQSQLQRRAEMLALEKKVNSLNAGITTGKKKRKKKKPAA